ncbi:Yqey-like protein-domain-containing protein [Hyaloraphidium curvatum]|nr:Yqey-like protein-domain-containing protein [Hyaloraphidium curvatum]
MSATPLSGLSARLARSFAATNASRCLLQSVVAGVGSVAPLPGRRSRAGLLYSTDAAKGRNTQLKERLQTDLKAAMRQKEKLRLAVVKSLVADIKYAETSERPPDDLVVVIQKALKKRQDSVEQYKAGGRPELAENEEAEIAIVNEYLPKQLSPEELEQLVRDCAAAVSATGPGDLGKVIKEVGSRADAVVAPRKDVSAIAKRILGDAKK